MSALKLTALIFMALLFGIPASTAYGGALVWTQSDGKLYSVERPEVTSASEAICAIVAGPTLQEAALGFGSGIPAGTKLLSSIISPGSVVVDLSKEATAGLSEPAMFLMSNQLACVIKQFNTASNIRILVEGSPLSGYLPSQPLASCVIRAQGEAASPGSAAVGLSGKRITLSPGHGWMYTGSQWATQRPSYCKFEPEDMQTLKTAAYLKAYLENDGAYVQAVREFDTTRGPGPSGHPWWEESAYVYLCDQGYGPEVCASNTGDPGYTGPNRGGDDVRARALASDDMTRGNTDIYLSIHTNGFTGDCSGNCPSGTNVYYDNGEEHQAYGAASRDLANAVSTGVISAIQRDADPTWTAHGVSVQDSRGNYGEIRIPHRPAVLIEIGFHDSCNTDAPKLEDPFFQSVSMWGEYNGVCSYFGVTPTWAAYSSQYVSDTIPARMIAGQTQSVSVTFRNKGILWSDARDFRLGALGDSDCFACIRQSLGSALVGPNGEYTFMFNFTAPLTPGSYVTDWQMVRDGYAWFGDAIVKPVAVVSPGAALPSGVWRRPRLDLLHSAYSF